MAATKKKTIDVGEAVGIVAAQYIGEPEVACLKPWSGGRSAGGCWASARPSANMRANPAMRTVRFRIAMILS